MTNKCSPQIKIGSFSVGHGAPPFVVAEMSGNHNGSLPRALSIVDAAAKSGAHALKLQTYTADSMTFDLNEAPFVIEDPKSLWYGRSLYSLYQEAATPYEWHGPIMDRCHEHGMACFSTPFDEGAVDFLESLDVPCYKVASFELTDIPLIRKIASTGKPLIMSTGMASLAEIRGAVDAARCAGAYEIILLKCTSSYPASPEDSNILTIPNMRETFGVQVGLSDHTMGVGVAVASVALGATFIEKHFTLSRAEGGVDSAFSLEPTEFNQLVTETKRAWLGLGVVSYQAGTAEEKSKQFRRCIRFARDLPEGHLVTRADLAIVRPSGGIEPGLIDHVVGKRLVNNVRMGHAVVWETLEACNGIKGPEDIRPLSDP